MVVSAVAMLNVTTPNIRTVNVFVPVLITVSVPQLLLKIVKTLAMKNFSLKHRNFMDPGNIVLPGCHYKWSFSHDYA